MGEKLTIDELNKISKAWIKDHRKLYSADYIFKISTDVILENMFFEPQNISYENVVKKEIFNQLKTNGWTKYNSLRPRSGYVTIGVGDKGEIYVLDGNHRCGMINANINRIKRYRLLHFKFPINKWEIPCKIQYMEFSDNHKPYRFLPNGTRFFPNGLIPKWNR